MEIFDSSLEVKGIEDRYDPVKVRQKAYEDGWGEVYDFLDVVKENYDMFEGHKNHYHQAIFEGLRQLVEPTKPYRIHGDVRNNVATLVELVLYNREQELANGE